MLPDLNAKKRKLCAKVKETFQMFFSRQMYFYLKLLVRVCTVPCYGMTVLKLH